MNYKIAITHTFNKELKRLAKKHRSIKADVSELGQQLEQNPAMGDEVMKNCYKIRMAITSKNKTNGLNSSTLLHYGGFCQTYGLPHGNPFEKSLM